MKARLSVVLPNYNHARYLPESLSAILEQSYPPDELIVIDDASTDNSVEILKEFQKKYPNLKLHVHERNQGVLASVDDAFSRATGTYILFASADDKLLPGLFEKSMALLEAHPNAGLCSGLAEIIDQGGRSRGLLPTPLVTLRPAYLSPADVLYHLQRIGLWFVPVTAVFNRQFLIDAGGFRRELGAGADGFLAEVVAVRHGACFIPEPLAAWRRLDEGYSSTQRVDIDDTMRGRRLEHQFLRDQFSTYFPESYRRQRQRRVLFECIRNAGRGRKKAKDLFSLMAAELPHHTILDRLFFLGARLLPSALNEHWLRLYLFMQVSFAEKRRVLLGR